ncbi:M57 family metalloprotease [Erysipelotrichaceae bacterium OttesenSCG-928-M19]|nr:M57 family metalloprotease [Erysipelotrichaceae bacterium OttesenSCG-928-M19]
MKKLVNLLIIIFVLLFISLTDIKIQNDCHTVSASSTLYKKIKLNSGYKFNLFHDKYVRDLAGSKKVKIYFNQSNVSSTRLKSSIKSVIKTFNSNRGSKKLITLYYSKPSGKYYIVNIYQSSNNYLCDSAGWSYACANQSTIYVNKKTAVASANLQKRIIFHEMLHVFGLDHTTSSTKGTSLTPAVQDGHRKFSIKNYPKDIEAWKILNKPYRIKTAKKGKTVEKRKYFLNNYLYRYSNKYKKKYKKIIYYYAYNKRIRVYIKYNSKGRVSYKKEYYSNGRLNKYKVYRSNKKLKYIKIYHTNGKLKGYNKYNTKGKVTSMREYNTKAQIYKQTLYHSNNKLKKINYYFSNGKTSVYSNYNTSGKITSKYTYRSNYKLEYKYIYYSSGKTKEKYYYSNTGRIYQIDYYDINGNYLYSEYY